MKINKVCKLVLTAAISLSVFSFAGCGSNIINDMNREYDVVSIEDIIGTIELEDNIVYDGTEKHPVISVTDENGNTLTPEEDYKVTYTNAVNAGTDTAGYTITGKGNYTGSVNGSFTIKPRPVTLTSDNFSVTPLIYNSQERNATDLEVTTINLDKCVSDDAFKLKVILNDTVLDAGNYTCNINAEINSSNYELNGKNEFAIGFTVNPADLSTYILSSLNEDTLELTNADDTDTLKLINIKNIDITQDETELDINNNKNKNTQPDTFVKTESPDSIQYTVDVSNIANNNNYTGSASFTYNSEITKLPSCQEEGSKKYNILEKDKPKCKTKTESFTTTISKLEHDTNSDQLVYINRLPDPAIDGYPDGKPTGKMDICTYCIAEYDRVTICFDGWACQRHFETVHDGTGSTNSCTVEEMIVYMERFDIPGFWKLATKQCTLCGEYK